MDKKSKYLLWALITLFLVSVGWKYYVFIIQRDFIVQTTTSCDPATEVCFSGETEEGEIEYYKKIEKNARNIVPCDPLENGECPDLICEPGEEECSVSYCSEDTVEAEEACTDTIEFTSEDTNTIGVIEATANDEE